MRTFNAFISRYLILQVVIYFSNIQDVRREKRCFRQREIKSSMKYLGIFTYGRNISECSFLVCEGWHCSRSQRCALGSNVLINSLHWRILWILFFSSMFPSCTSVPYKSHLYPRHSSRPLFRDRKILRPWIRPAFRSVVKSISRRCRQNEKEVAGSCQIVVKSGESHTCITYQKPGEENFVMRELVTRQSLLGQRFSI